MKGISFSRLTGFQSTFKKWNAFFPIQTYLIFFLLIGWFARWWLNQQFQNEPGPFNDILGLLLQLVKGLIIPVIFFGGLSAIIPFLLFWMSYRKRKVEIKLESPEDQPEYMERLLKLEIYPLLTPLLGQVYFKLLYDQNERESPRFLLSNHQKSINIFSKRHISFFTWPLPDIREYEVDTMIVSFEDVFHFFKFALPVKVRQSFFTKPKAMPVSVQQPSPTLPENEEIKIEDWRKIQGELLQYKHFESNDDVRRIVWKIYAKNKELMVRMHEITDPFASHIRLDVSFYNGLFEDENATIHHECLDYYKNMVYSLYQQLTSNGIKVRFHSDCPEKWIPYNNENLAIEYNLSASYWQQSINLQSLVKEDEKTIVCISSLSDQADVKKLLDYHSDHITIGWIPISKAFKKPVGLQWLRWVWIEAEKDPHQKGKIGWFVSKERRKMEENERIIFQTIRQSPVQYISF